MTFKNPVLRGFNADPSLCKVGEDFYLATSTFEWYPGVQIHHSRDLENWALVSRPLGRADQLDMRGNPDGCGVWAPALSYADGLFWLIYTNVRRFDGNYKDTPNYLTTAPAIDGPWSPGIYLNNSGFDPSLFHDDDGRKYLLNMVWDHRATLPGRQSPADLFGGILMQEYDHAQQRLIGKVRKIFHRSPIGMTEAPHIFKRDGFYYLITAEGGTSYDHAVTHARARDINGPYEIHPQNPVLTTAGSTHGIQRVGHGQLVDLGDGTALHSFLCSRPVETGVTGASGETRRSPMGREAGLVRLRFRDDGWVEPVAAEDLPLQDRAEPVAAKVVDYDFAAADSLPMDFQWLRSPQPERLFSLTENPGRLTLFGRESIGNWFEQALVARRRTEFRCSFETSMEFDPEDFQQMAGLVVYYNRQMFHYLCVSQDDDGVKRLMIQSIIKGWPDCPLDFPVGEGEAVPRGETLHLGVDINDDALQFRYRLEGGEWTSFGPVLSSFEISDEGGRGEHANFTGTFIGMAAQDLTGQARQATFAAACYTEG